MHISWFLVLRIEGFVSIIIVVFVNIVAFVLYVNQYVNSYVIVLKCNVNQSDLFVDVLIAWSLKLNIFVACTFFVFYW